MQYIEKVKEDIVNFEMSNFSEEDFTKYNIDKNKWFSEGSIWIVYIYDKMNEYYHKNKQRIDNLAKKILLAEINK